MQKFIPIKYCSLHTNSVSELNAHIKYVGSVTMHCDYDLSVTLSKVIDYPLPDYVDYEKIHQLPFINIPSSNLFFFNKMFPLPRPPTITLLRVTL